MATTKARTKGLTVEYVKTIGIVNTGATGRGFASPVDSTVSEDGRLFVLNRWTPFARVSVYSPDEEHLHDIGSHGDGDGQFRLPAAVVRDSRDRVFVADEYHHRISVFKSSGEFVGKWGAFGSSAGEINGPAGLAIDDDGNVFVADQNNHRIQKFTPEGDYVLQFGSPGDGEGQFNLPWGITLDSQGNLYVADWRNDRIQKFTADGQFLDSFGESGDGDGQFNRPSSVAVDGQGYIYVADWGNERVQVLGPDGSFQVELRGQATLSKWAAEYLDNTAEEKRERENSDLIPELPPHLDTPWLVSSQTEPYFWGPVSVKLDTEGRLYVTETPRHRIQVYQTR